VTHIRIFVSRRDRNSALRWLAVLVALFAVGAFALDRYAPALSDPAALRAYVEGFGIWAPVVFVCLQAAQVVVAPVPGQVVVLLGGYLFGTVAGVTYSLVGATLGSAVAFWLARRYGRRYVERVVTESTLARFDRLTRNNAVPALFVAFLVPGLPDDVLCFVGGLTEVPIRRLVAVAALGRLPSFLLVSVIGGELAGGRVAVAVVLAAALVAVAGLSYLLRDRLLGRLER
jgi:uncharacterized membrane protein YdjX (TVP38/TMEM64 family)